MGKKARIMTSVKNMFSVLEWYIFLCSSLDIDVRVSVHHMFGTVVKNEE
jgi:hypothetical protein